MKRILLYLPALLLLASAYVGCSRKAVYSTLADTTNLNKEYREVSRDAAKTRGELEETRSKIPIYQAKAVQAENKSREFLEASSRQAERATSGNVKQARKAEKKADKAAEAAEDARDLREDVEKLEDKLERLINDLDKKEQRLRELEEQRLKIENLPRPENVEPSKSATDTTSAL